MRTARRSRTIDRGGWGDDAWAAIAGALEGFGRAWETKQAREDAERRQALDEQYRRDSLTLRARESDRDEQRQREAAERTESDSALAKLNELRNVHGPGRMLSSPDAATANALATKAGREFMLAPGVTDWVPAPTVPGGPVLAPMAGGSVFRENAEERAAREQREQAERARRDVLSTMPPTVRRAVELGLVTGRPPTVSPELLEDPETVRQREVDTAVAREKALSPIRLEEARGRAAIDAAHRPGPPVRSRDDPRMPMGVRSYLGKLMEKYGIDRAAAEGELRRAVPSLLGAHPRLDLATLRREFDAAFPKPATSRGGATVDQVLEGLGVQEAADPPRSAGPPIAGRTAGATTALQSPAAATGATDPSADTQAAIVTLKAQLREAIQKGDVGRVQHLRDELARLAGR